MCEQESDFLRFACFSTPPAFATTFTYIFGLCVTHNIFALYTSDDNDKNNNNNNVSNMSERMMMWKKCMDSLSYWTKAVSMLPPKTKPNERKEWNGKKYRYLIERKKKGIFRALQKKKPNLDMYNVCYTTYIDVYISMYTTHIE